MRGHIRKRGSGYQIIVDIGRDPLTNKRKQKSIGGFKTKKEAEKALAEMIAKVEKGEYFEAENITLKEYLDKWIKAYCETNFAPKTLKSYKEMIEWYILPKLGHVDIQKIKPLHIQEFYKICMDEYNLSGTTTRYIHTILHTAFKHAVKWQLLLNNPTDAVEPPKRNKNKFSVLTANEIEILLNSLKGSSLYYPTLIAISTGMRRGEILGLRWSDIDLKYGYIYIENQLQRINKKFELVPTKTAKSKRKIAIPQLLINELKELRKQQLENKLALGSAYCDLNFVCCKANGEPYDPDYISRHFMRVMERISKQYNIPDVRFHDLRHSHATLLLKEGTHPKIVSERLGHSQIGITLDTYSHVLPEMQKEAADKIDSLLSKKA